MFWSHLAELELIRSSPTLIRWSSTEAALSVSGKFQIELLRELSDNEGKTAYLGLPYL